MKIRWIVLFAVLTALFSLQGCGSSGSAGFNPAPASEQVVTSVTPPFSNTSSATGKYAISLSVDPPTVDAGVGQILATAKVQGTDGAAVADQQVSFSVIAGPASIVQTLASQFTDANGQAVTIVTPGNPLSTTNVLVMAETTINGKAIRAYAPFKIVRGTGIVSFITSKNPTDPDGTLTTLDKTVEANFAGTSFEFMQQLPFKVTDANGNPRVGVPVTISIENQLTGKATTGFRNPTVVTDSAGKGIFNIGVFMTAPPTGVTHTDSIIYKAVTTEASGVPALTSYTGFVVSMTTNYVPLSIVPGEAGFGSASSIRLTISGGVKPYTVKSSAPSLVSATLLPDGSGVEAALLDTTAWTTPVKISVTDAAGNTTSAALSR